MPYPAPNWEPVAPGRKVFRLVNATSPDDEARPEWFLTDREAGIDPWFREEEWEELRDARSFFASENAARAEYAKSKKIADKRGEEVRMPGWIAEVALMPADGVAIDDLKEPDEHLLIRGDKELFVPWFERVFRADE